MDEHDSLKKSKASDNKAHESSESDEDVHLEQRILIDNVQVGGIIGKAGANVKHVRDESGAFVSILKAEYRSVAERIMVLKGNPSQVAQCCKLICDLMLDAATSRDGKKKPASSGDSEAQLRLLVHRSAVGAIIGKAGATIKETQSNTNTRIQISNTLPQSTEKTVTITGSPEEVHKATLRVLQQLASSPLPKNTPKVYHYVPGQPAFNPYGLGALPPLHPAGPPPAPYQSMYPQPIIPHYLGAGVRAGGKGLSALPPPLPLPPVAGGSTQKIAIPTACAGCVIGKGGSVIRDLRHQSGTNISIADPDAACPTERVVTLTGAPQGIQTAVYLIRQLVEQYQPQQSQA